MENVSSRRGLIDLERTLSRITTIAEDPEDGSEERENDNIAEESSEIEEEIDEEPSSTAEDEERIKELLQKVMSFKRSNVSNWVIEEKINELEKKYKKLFPNHKSSFLRVLAHDYAVNHDEAREAAKLLVNGKDLDEKQVLQYEDNLKNIITPNYNWFFHHVGRLDKGVKFLVDLRTDVLDTLSTIDTNDLAKPYLTLLNSNLRDLLALWFSVGFLSLERVTWASSCDMLQKISDYEAVHPMRNWTELKRRVGPNRRCFVYTHGSMPGEPIVVLHTALTDEIPSTLRTVVTPASTSRMSVDASAGMGVHHQADNLVHTKAAIFYSITSTQKGLQGIELGTYLIKRVVSELQSEFPHMKKFSSLSPIPKFRQWLLDKIKNLSEGDETDLFTVDEINLLRKEMEKSHPGDSWNAFKEIFNNNSWALDALLLMLLETPLMRLCARYLYLEKKRGAALDPVGMYGIAASLLNSTTRITYLDAEINSVASFTLSLSSLMKLRQVICILPHLQTVDKPIAVVYVAGIVYGLANFHLRNGAMMWRLNWKADMTSRGLDSSFGIMVNYRYFLDNAEKHSRMYLEDREIACSDQVRHLAKLASDLTAKTSKQKT